MASEHSPLVAPSIHVGILTTITTVLYIHHSKQVATGHTPHPFRLAFALLIGLPTRAIAMLYRIRTKLRSHHKLRTTTGGFLSFLSQMHEKGGNFCMFLLKTAEKEGKQRPVARA